MAFLLCLQSAVLLLSVQLLTVLLLAVLMLFGLLHSHALVEEVACAPVEESALLASGTDRSLLLLLLVREPAGVSVASALFVEMALLDNFLEAIESLATVLCSLVFSDFL